MNIKPSCLKCFTTQNLLPFNIGIIIRAALRGNEPNLGGQSPTSTPDNCCVQVEERSSCTDHHGTAQMGQSNRTDSGVFPERVDTLVCN